MRLENAIQERQTRCEHHEQECLLCGFGLPQRHLRWVNGTVRYMFLDVRRGPNGVHIIFLGAGQGAEDVCVEINVSWLERSGLSLPSVGEEVRICLAWSTPNDPVGDVIAIDHMAQAGGAP